MTLFERLRRGLRDESGFGLIELLSAMLMLNVGIIALVAAFTSGQVSLRRAGEIGTASTVADRQMELYRSVKWTQILLDQTSLSSADATYRCDPIYGTDCAPLTDADAYKVAVSTTGCTLPLANQCIPSRLVTGADNKSYRVDTYIVPSQVTSGRDVRRVTVVVRRASNLQALARQTSDFDESTG